MNKPFLFAVPTAFALLLAPLAASAAEEKPATPKPAAQATAPAKTAAAKDVKPAATTPTTARSMPATQEVAVEGKHYQASCGDKTAAADL